MEESHFFSKDLGVEKGLSKESTGGSLKSEFSNHSVLCMSAQTAHIGLMLNGSSDFKTATNCKQ